MRLVSLDARLGIEVEGHFIDVEARSDGRFSSDPMSVFGIWDEIRSWAADQTARDTDPSIDLDRLGPPSPRFRSQCGSLQRAAFDWSTRCNWAI